jgi:hypothetical protein
MPWQRSTRAVHQPTITYVYDVVPVSTGRYRYVPVTVCTAQLPSEGPLPLPSLAVFEPVSILRFLWITLWMAVVLCRYSIVPVCTGMLVCTGIIPVWSLGMYRYLHTCFCDLPFEWEWVNRYRALALVHTVPVYIATSMLCVLVVEGFCELPWWLWVSQL